jgi:hypothetical protein
MHEPLQQLDNFSGSCNNYIHSKQASYELLLPYVQAHDCLGKLMEVQSYADRLAKMKISNYQF